MHPLLLKRHTFISPLAIHHIIERHGIPRERERKKSKKLYSPKKWKRERIR